MISFKKFLEAAVTREPAYEVVQADKALEIFETHCKDATWMLEENTPFYRGQEVPSSTLRAAGYLSVDTSATERKSQNTTNYYTVILDNNPACKDFPKRSRSFIATTNRSMADNFAAQADYGRTYIMIPYDDTKIGVCPHDDIWYTSMKLFGVSQTMNNFNNDFEMMGLKPTIASFEKFDTALKDEDGEAFREFKRAFSKAEQYKDKFLETIWQAFSPQNTKLEAYTTATLPHGLKNREVWVGGKVLLITPQMWTDMREAIKK